MTTKGNILVSVANGDLVNGTFTIPKGVTHIGEGAFEGCTGLPEIPNY